jgi:DNA-directed RNA polymerase specialized sigma24 family protein
LGGFGLALPALLRRLSGVGGVVGVGDCRLLAGCSDWAGLYERPARLDHGLGSVGFGGTRLVVGGSGLGMESVDRGSGFGADPLLASTHAGRSMVVLGDLYEANFDRLCGLAAAITLDRAAGPEIVQDAFAGLTGRFEHVRDPVAYLQRSVVNLSIRVVKRRDRARRVPMFPVGHHVSREVDELWDLVGRLPARQRAVVVLRFWEDLTYEQIAGVLDVPLGTVQSRLHRGLAKLREEIE